MGLFGHLEFYTYFQQYMLIIMFDAVQNICIKIDVCLQAKRDEEKIKYILIEKKFLRNFISWRKSYDKEKGFFLSRGSGPILNGVSSPSDVSNLPQGVCEAV